MFSMLDFPDPQAPISATTDELPRTLTLLRSLAAESAKSARPRRSGESSVSRMGTSPSPVELSGALSMSHSMADAAGV